VRKGDTLSRIAQRNGTTVSRICKLNGIKKTSILRPGQVLRLR
jgi:LysM repeat protein